ncbi:MAG TPA: DUF6427 family protein [Sphingobacteriaceae bacterium]
MISQFRNFNPFNIFLLVIITFALRLGILADLPPRLDFEIIEPFGKLLIAIPTEDLFTPLQNVLLAAVIVIIQALLFNRVVNNHSLLSKPTWLPALLYVTLSSLFFPFLELSPALICNFLMIWMINHYLGIHKHGRVLSVMYDTGMVIAIGTIIYFPFIVMVLTLWLCLIIFRPFSWREWVSGIVGFATIFFFIAVFYYWNDALDKFYGIWLPLTSTFPTRLNINLHDYLLLIPVAVILFLGFLQLRQKFFRSFVQVRKSFQLLFLMFVVALVSFYLKRDYPVYHFILCVPMAAVLMAYYFLNATVKWFYESLYLILVAAIVYFQFF